MESEILRIMKERRSIRKYKPEQIEQEKLDAVLEAGMYAPTGAGRQGIKIIAVQSPENVKKVDELNAKVLNRADVHPYYGAPIVLLVLATEDAMTPELDGAAVCMNMLNTAYAMGLGSCWIHRCREMFELEEGKALLKQWGIEENLKGIASMALGYADCSNPAAAPRKADYVIRV